MHLTNPPSRRARPLVPRTLRDDFGRVVKARGIVGTTVLVPAVLTAAWEAEQWLKGAGQAQARGQLLPPSPLPPAIHRIADPVEVWWTQGHREYVECQHLIEQAGSNLSAVLTDVMQRCVDADGDWRGQFRNPGLPNAMSA